MSGPAKPAQTASAPNPLTQPPSVAEMSPPKAVTPKAVTGAATGLAADQGSLTSESSTSCLSTLLNNFCNYVSKLFKNLTNWFVNLLPCYGSNRIKAQANLAAKQWIAKQKQEFAALDTSAPETSPIHWLVMPSSGEPTGINGQGFKFAFLSDGPSAYNFFFMKEVINTVLEECLSSQDNYSVKAGTLCVLLDSFQTCFKDFQDDSLQEYGGDKVGGLHDHLLNEVIGHLEKNKLFKHLIIFKQMKGIKSPQVTALLKSVSDSLSLNSTQLKSTLTKLETSPEFQQLSPLDAACFIDCLGTLVYKQLRTKMIEHVSHLSRTSETGRSMSGVLIDIVAKASSKSHQPSLSDIDREAVEMLETWQQFYVSYQVKNEKSIFHFLFLSVKANMFRQSNGATENSPKETAVALYQEEIYRVFASKPNFLKAYAQNYPNFCAKVSSFCQSH